MSVVNNGVNSVLPGCSHFWLWQEAQEVTLSMSVRLSVCDIVEFFTLLKQKILRLVYHESVVPELDKNVPRVVAARGKEWVRVWLFKYWIFQFLVRGLIPPGWLWPHCVRTMGQYHFLRDERDVRQRSRIRSELIEWEGAVCAGEYAALLSSSYCAGKCDEKK